MKLSIITINLNNAKGLEITIRTIIEQTFNDYELIVIDGVSTDGSIEVINKYSAYITYWVSEPDKGVYNAMNKGIMKSIGNYCFFLNSGDWLYDKFVLEQVFEGNPNESLITGNIIIVRDEVVRREKYEKLSFGLFYTGTICHQASFIKRNLFFKFGLYDENLRIVADWKFFLITIVLNNEPVKYKDINIAYHDLFGISISNEELFMEERSKVFRELIPAIILLDYNSNQLDIKQMIRLKQYKLTKYLVWFCDRCLNRVERIVAKKERNSLNSNYKSRLSELSR